MGIISKLFTFSSGATILASEHNTNLDTLYTLVNGNIDNNNIKTGAGIVYSKLVLTNSIVLADLASAIKSGSDATLITGTAGTENYIAKWNADGDLVDGYAFIDDDTMATASATNIASAESVKEYVDTEIANATPSAELGDVLQASADTERNIDSTTYYLLKDIQVPRDGTYRIKYETKSTTSQTYNFRIYRNGTGVGTAHSNNNTTYEETTDDISGWSAGDSCQLWVNNNGNGQFVYVKNFRIYEASGVDYIVNTN